MYLRTLTNNTQCQSILGSYILSTCVCCCIKQTQKTKDNKYFSWLSEGLASFMWEICTGPTNEHYYNY